MISSSLFSQKVYNPDYVWHNPEKVVTAEPCGECHQLEYKVWKETKHATGFKTLHRTQLAERIKERMGLKLIKRESLCLKCHYLAGIKKGQLRALSGVSCESCHGAARDWINIHNNYGKGYDYRTEPPEHKAWRIAESKARGMFRPSELYEVVANCFQCHTVPHEKLVNVGGHTTGSRDFEFVKWMDKIRHNFLQAQFDPTKTENREHSPERKRVMFVVGKAVDLEYSIRATAIAKEQGVYIKAMQRRVRNAIVQLNAINKRVALPEIEGILKIAGQVNITLNNHSNLLKAADKIRTLIKKFIKNNDGFQLASLDSLMAGIGVTKTLVTSIDTTTNIPIPSSPEKKSVVNYEKRRYIRPRSQYKTLGPSCNCHVDQNKWWATDPHYRSIDPFYNRETKNVQIAQLYGIKISEMTKGNQLCMDCHGTIVSGQESQEVLDGVSCESCHGPASEYRKPHTEGGYRVGKNLGMILLENVNIQAEVCAQCHYITDPRLISTGHPTGADFDFVAGNQKIKHWQKPIFKPEELKNAYERIKHKRGPIPQVTLVDKSRSFGSPIVSNNSPTIQPISNKVLIVPQKRELKLPPFPVISDSTSIEQILLLLKARLELLYKKLYKE